MKKLRVFLASVVVLSAFILFPTENASAQCTTPSSCKTCHEVQEQKPVLMNGTWHIDHFVFDFCVDCHGGTRTAQTAARAHKNISNSLAGMAAGCLTCHPDDLEGKFSVYAKELGVSDPNILNQARLATPQPPGQAFMPLNAMAIPLPVDPMSTQKTPVAGSSASSALTLPPEDYWPNAILSFLLVAGVGGGTSYVVWNERRLKGWEKSSWSVWVRGLLRRESWSPYAAGVLLGITAILSIVAGRHLLSASGGMASITSTTVNAAAPEASKSILYFRAVPPGINWEILLLAGIFLGGLLSALSSGSFHLQWNEDKLWKRVIGPQPWKRFVIGFIGAMILQYGASIAGGCTSGLAISGGLLLAPGAYLFMAGMFVSGIMVALIVYRRRY